MIRANLKRKAYRRARLIDNAWLWACVFGFGYLFIIALLEAM